MRALLALVLAILLAIASQSEALARAEMAGAQMTEACGAGAVMIDAMGKALVRHDCTHCLAATGAALLPATMALPRRARGAAPKAAADIAPLSRPATEPLARGPPLFL